ncbi:MAG: sulfatase-like hydrolase/transferase, partial [Burkholderiales bacterium]|nr:sulfatase-like hydrolase/transferase [Burkholderiales bacterium]
MTSASAPNIVLLMADQLTPFALPFHGRPLVRAPALSRLAAEGVVFDAAYCNFPICAPSRYSMLSG